MDDPSGSNRYLENTVALMPEELVSFFDLSDRDLALLLEDGSSHGAHDRSHSTYRANAPASLISISQAFLGSPCVAQPQVLRRSAEFSPP
jgi:hypothetical protein